MRFGEDLDFSMRLLENGFTTRLLKDAYLFHKRRNNFFSFFKQVYNSGIARINLEFRHRRTIKPVHWLPTLFVFGHLIIIVLAIFSPAFLLLLAVVPVIILIDSAIQTKSIKTSFLAIIASFVQLFGYGLGFIKAFIYRVIFKKREFYAFHKNFYGKDKKNLHKSLQFALYA
jgi:GT2 family glycosyltransferase